MRNVENQPLVISLDKGMDQSKGERSAEPGTLTLVKNGRNRSGRLQKRCGSSAVTGDSIFVSSVHALSDTSEHPRPVEHPAFIGKIGDQTVAGTSGGLAFGRTTKWRVQGGTSAAQPVRKRLGIAPTLPTRPLGPYVAGAAVTSSGFICTAAGFGPELRITIEGPTGELAYERSTVVGAAGVIVRVVCVNATFYVMYQGSASTTVTVRSLTIASGVISDGGTATLATLANASSTWDTSGYDTSNWYLAYQSGATTVTVSRMTGTSATASATFSTTNNLTYLSVWADSVTARVFVGSVDDPASTHTAAYRIYTTTPALSVGPTTLHSLFTSKGPPLFGPLYTRTPAAGDAFAVLCVDTEALGVGSSPIEIFTYRIVGGSAGSGLQTCYNMLPISKPDAQQRVWCVSYATGSNYQTAKILLLRFADADQAAAMGGPGPIVELASPDMETPGSTYHPLAASNRAFHAVAITTESAGGSAFFALPFVLESRTNASGATEPSIRADVYEYSRYNQEPHRQMAPAGSAAIVSGQPTELWGVQTQINGSPFAVGAVELGFASGPSVLASATTPNASGVAVGSYVYQVLQRWFDDEGNLHESAPSAPLAVTLTEPSTVTLRIAGCYVGQRLAPERPIETASPQTVVYRTQNGGTEAQEVPIVTAEPSTIWLGYVTATDTVSDGIIDDNEFIYTAGGVLPNVLAPSCRYIAVSEERLWCGGLWDSNIIECSKVRVPGEPYNFTGDPSHQVVIPGEVTGLAYMDGQIGVFTEDAVYIVGGDGPNDQGAGGFAPPRALIRGVGCPRDLSASILETEAGIIFRSKLAYYLIPRGWGSPVNIGEKVHDEDEVVLSAATTTTAEYRLARFLICADGETKSDTVLTLDLTSMQWFRDTYNVDGASITGQGFSEIGEWPDGLALFSYGLQRTDNLNVVWAENESLTGDAGAAGVGVSTFISLYAQTAWQYGQTGPMGRLRVENVALLFEAAGACGLNMTVEAGNDGSDVAYAQNATQWTIAASSDEQYRYLTVKFPECTAFRITLYDAATSGDSSGLRMIALGASVSPLGGMRPPLNSTERQ